MADDATQFQKGLFSFLKMLAALVGAGSIVAGAIWWAVSPRFERWLDERNAVIVNQIAALQATVDRLDVNEQVQVVEFRGAGIPLGRAPYEAGDAVPILFLLRRNSRCAATVQARFLDADTGQLLSQYTYETPATRAPITRDFFAFPVGVELPHDMATGRYIYNAQLIPDVSECPGQRVITPPLSLPFAVVNNGR